MELDIKIKLVSPEAKVPAYATDGAAGMDLCAAIDAPVVIPPGEIRRIPTGIAIGLPACSVVGLIYPRSGLSSRHGITMANCVGVIDGDYRGEIVCPMINLGREAYSIEPGDRIAQIVFAPLYRANFTRVEALDETDRGAGGFGSTGK